jgi:TatD DNase family protein
LKEKNNMLVDSHCHLDFKELNSDIEGVLQRAKEADVQIMQTICTKIKELPNIIKIAEQYDNVFASVGTHPHEAQDEVFITTEQLYEYTKHPKIIGIGETGLDYYYQHSPKELQQQAFKAHIATARKSGLPVIIHTRDAEDDTISILEEEMKNGTFKALIHCFTASEKFAYRVLDMGLYISVSGIITFNKSEDLRQIVKTIPIDRLLVETDAPFLAPTPHRGKVNEPAYTKLVAEKVAEIKSLSFEEVANQTTKNFFSLFSKATL